MVTGYETNQVREIMGEVKELESLRHHLARVEEIYIGLVKNGQDYQGKASEKLFKAEDEARNAKAAAHEAQKTAAEAIKEAQAQADAALARETAAKEVQEMREVLARSQNSQEQSSKLATLSS